MMIDALGHAGKKSTDGYDAESARREEAASRARLKESSHESAKFINKWFKSGAHTDGMQRVS